jgi:hypothetical protein
MPSRKRSKPSSLGRFVKLNRCKFLVSLTAVKPPSQVNVTGVATPNVSGALEVLILNNKALVHSKKGGDGYVDTPEKMQKIKDAVKAVVG